MTNFFDNALKINNSSGDSHFTSLRKAAISRVLAKGFPTRKDEDWKYTNIKPIVSSSYTLAPSVESFSPDDELQTSLDRFETRVVFVNGVLSAALSKLENLPKEISLKPLNQLSEKEVSEITSKIHVEEGDVFSDLNESFLNSGIYLNVPKGTKLEKLLGIFYVSIPGPKAQLSFPRTIISMAANSEARVFEYYLGVEGKEKYLTNSVTSCHLDPNAKLSVYRIQNENENAEHFSLTNLSLRKDAFCEHLSLSMGAGLCRNNLNIGLNESDSEVKHDGLYITAKNQHCDNHTMVDHRVPHTTSRQLYKGILNNSSRAVFNGAIKVKKDAQKTEAHQLNNNLLLSSDAEIDTKPQLEIDADDVKCSHGATIGQLGQDELFYLLSRGISEDEAMEMLSKGFASQVIYRILCPEAQKLISDSIEHKWNSL